MSERWWNKATLQQRLAQIDAGLELGMSSRVVAMAIGFGRDERNEGSRRVLAVANNHGRFFMAVPRTGPQHRRIGDKISARAAYERGEPVDFWREGRGVRPSRDGAEPLLDEVEQ